VEVEDLSPSRFPEPTGDMGPPPGLASEPMRGDEAPTDTTLGSSPDHVSDPGPGGSKGKGASLPYFPAPGADPARRGESSAAKPATEKLAVSEPIDDPKMGASPAVNAPADKPPEAEPPPHAPADSPAARNPPEPRQADSPAADRPAADKPTAEDIGPNSPAVSDSLLSAFATKSTKLQGSGLTDVPYGLLVLGSLLLAFSQIIYGQGWPMSHEGTGWLQRMNVVRNALSHGDIFPLWWSDGAWGLGSPMPLLYHKLFNFIAAPLSLVIGNVKDSVVVTLAILSAAGIYGLRRLCEQVTAPGWIPNVLALSFPHLSYAVTDWLVRGSFAEYAAMAVGTWLLAWCAALVRTGHVSRSIVPILVGMFLAHSVIAMYGLLLVALALGIWLSRSAHRTKSQLRELGLAAALCLGILGPLLLLMGVVSSKVNTGYLDTGVYHPVRQFWDLSRYVWDENYVWGIDWRSYTVQLDTVLLLALFAAGVALAVVDFRNLKPRDSGRDSTPPLAAHRRGSALWFILVSLFVVLFLQTRAAAGYYNHVPGAALLQFPWRLLSFAAPLLVALVCSRFVRLQADTGAGVRCAVATAVLLLVTSPALRPIRYDRLPESVLTSQRMPPSNEWREYWPGRADRTPQIEGYIRDLAHQGVSDVAKGRCFGSEMPSEEYLVRKFSVVCKDKSVVALPVASYGLSSVRADKGRLKHSSVADDPRLRVELPAGNHVLRVELPTVWRLVPAFIFG
jgi:hypothetical protein